MKRMISVLGLTVAAGILAAWACGAPQWGILNAANASVADLHQQIVAQTPMPPWRAATVTPALPGDTLTPTPSPTLTPYPPVETVSPTPFVPTNQVLWSNGTAAPQWWNQTLSVGTDNAATGSIANASISDPISGDSTVLQYTAAGVSDTGQVVFSIPNFTNPYEYEASGHLQFDIMLGPAWNSSNSLKVLIGENPSDGQYPVYGAETTQPLTGLGSSFVHESMALNGTGPWGSGMMIPVNVLEIGVIDVPDMAPSVTLPAGVQFYIDHVQFTTN